MAKKKTSKQHEASSIKDIPIVKLKNKVKTTKHDPSNNLGDPKFIAEALAQCLLEGDQKEFMKILLAHCQLRIKSTSQISVYQVKNTFNELKSTTNPRLETIIKLTKELNLNID